MTGILHDVLWVVLYESLIVIGTGTLVGACLSLVGSRLVSSLLAGLSPRDLLTLAASAVLLSLVPVASGCCRRGETRM